jgi:hypothetical protein
MSQSRFLKKLKRARKDLDEAVTELSTLDEATTPGTVPSDLLEIRARVQALTSRVDVIEERGEH